jgi:hypothetical protein
VSLEPALPEWNFAVFLKPAVLLPVPEPNNFAASQRPEVQEQVPGPGRNSFSALRKLAVQVPGPNNFVALRKHAAPEPEQNSFSALRKLAAQVRAPETNSFAVPQRPAAPKPGLTELAENRKAEKGQAQEPEPAPERKPADD